MNKTVRTILVYGVVVVLMVVVAQTWFESGDQPKEITASEFVQQVENGEVEEVTIFTRSDLVTDVLLSA
jgi:ATP-dependent Zn protease